MPIQPSHAVAPYFLLAELGASLFGASAMAAEERITLEVIGAVRMAAPDANRRPAAASQPSEVRPVRETIAEGTDAAMGSVRH